MRLPGSRQAGSLQALHWGAAGGGHDTLLLHPAHLNAEVQALLSTQPSGPVWSVGLVERHHPSLTERVRTLLAVHHLSGPRLVLLGLSARAQVELAPLFPGEVQDFVALSLLPEKPLRTTLVHDLWPLLKAPPVDTAQSLTARGAA